MGIKTLFLEKKDEDSHSRATAKRLFQPGPTRYGRGTNLTLLSSQSINELFVDGISEVIVYVGIAYKLRLLTDSKPFRTKEIDKKWKKKANKKALNKQQEGFDSVRPKGMKNRNNCIYWVPGVCIPMVVLTLRRSYECQVCFDAFSLVDGIECRAPARHFVCNECFSNWVESESTTASLDLLAKRNGCIFCVSCPKDNNIPFTDADIAQHVPEKTFAVYSDGKKKLVENQIAKEMELEMKKRLEAELKRLEAMTEEQRKIDKARRDIEGMLNLKCPRCKAVFLDFDGCMSITCGQIGCGIAFCRWCQKDCDRDAHAHAGECTVPAEAKEEGFFL